MGITTVQVDAHWSYLLAIEQDLIPLSRYIEFSDQNFNCFSMELARILLAAASEVDVVSKLLCKKGTPTSTADNINQYRDELTHAYPGLNDFRVEIPRYGLKLCPWDEWKKPDGVPFWWTAYNKVKHQRQDNFHRANLKNVLNAIAGLFVIVLHLYRENAENGTLIPMPQLLGVDASHHGGFSLEGNKGMSIIYKVT